MKYLRAVGAGRATVESRIVQEGRRVVDAASTITDECGKTVAADMGGRYQSLVSATRRDFRSCWHGSAAAAGAAFDSWFRSMRHR
jgi:hypothetical protein